jgi:hypothetical protein
MESQVAEWQELMGKMRCSKGQKGKGAAKGSDSKGYDRAEMAEVLELAAQRMAQYDIELRAVQMRLIIIVGIYDEQLKQAFLDVSTEWNATTRKNQVDTHEKSNLPTSHRCGYSLNSCLFYTLLIFLREEAKRQNAFEFVPVLNELAHREDHDRLLYRVKHFSGHTQPRPERTWYINIIPSLDCPPDVVQTLIRLVCVLDASDAKIRPLPSALSNKRFLDDLHHDWKMKRGKAGQMPYLELFHDMNAWDNMMQEAARDYDPSRTLPIVPDARKDHAQRIAALKGEADASRKRHGRDENRTDGRGTTPRTDTDTAEFDLESWANQCIQDSKYIQQQQQHKPNSKYIQDSEFVVDKLQTYHYGFGRIASIAN